MKTFKQFVSRMNEEAPANAVGSGNIAGTGVGPQGEPGIKRPKKFRQRGFKWKKS